ncbi:hypothetical protein V1520DRAFT_348145, partial [Lipomyces starkeyi]
MIYCMILLSARKSLQISMRILHVRSGSVKKYMKYYTFMDVSDICYTALILDPRREISSYMNWMMMTL